METPTSAHEHPTTSELTTLRILQAEIGKDIADLRSEMVSECGKLRCDIANVKGDIKDASLNTLKWCIGTMLACTGIIVGALFAK